VVHIEEVKVVGREGGGREKGDEEKVRERGWKEKRKKNWGERKESAAIEG
jgi:hypothetical protein